MSDDNAPSNLARKEKTKHDDSKESKSSDESYDYITKSSFEEYSLNRKTKLNKTELPISKTLESEKVGVVSGVKTIKQKALLDEESKLIADISEKISLKEKITPKFEESQKLAADYYEGKNIIDSQSSAKRSTSVQLKKPSYETSINLIDEESSCMPENTENKRVLTDKMKDTSLYSVKPIQRATTSGNEQSGKSSIEVSEKEIDNKASLKGEERRSQMQSSQKSSTEAKLISSDRKAVKSIDQFINEVNQKRRTSMTITKPQYETVAIINDTNLDQQIENEKHKLKFTNLQNEKLKLIGDEEIPKKPSETKESFNQDHPLLEKSEDISKPEYITKISTTSKETYKTKRDSGESIKDKTVKKVSTIDTKGSASEETFTTESILQSNEAIKNDSRIRKEDEIINEATIKLFESKTKRPSDHKKIEDAQSIQSGDKKASTSVEKFVTDIASSIQTVDKSVDINVKNQIPDDSKTLESLEQFITDVSMSLQEQEKHESVLSENQSQSGIKRRTSVQLVKPEYEAAAYIIQNNNCTLEKPNVSEQIHEQIKDEIHDFAVGANTVLNEDSFDESKNYHENTSTDTQSHSGIKRRTSLQLVKPEYETFDIKINENELHSQELHGPIGVSKKEDSVCYSENISIEELISNLSSSFENKFEINKASSSQSNEEDKKEIRSRGRLINEIASNIDINNQNMDKCVLPSVEQFINDLTASLNNIETNKAETPIDDNISEPTQLNKSISTSIENFLNTITSSVKQTNETQEESTIPLSFTNAEPKPVKIKVLSSVEQFINELASSMQQYDNLDETKIATVEKPPKEQIDKKIKTSIEQFIIDLSTSLKPTESPTESIKSSSSELSILNETIRDKKYPEKSSQFSNEIESSLIKKKKESEKQKLSLDKNEDKKIVESSYNDLLERLVNEALVVKQTKHTNLCESESKEARSIKNSEEKKALTSVEKFVTDIASSIQTVDKSVDINVKNQIPDDRKTLESLEQFITDVSMSLQEQEKHESVLSENQSQSGIKRRTSVQLVKPEYVTLDLKNDENDQMVNETVDKLSVKEIIFPEISSLLTSLYPENNVVSVSQENMVDTRSATVKDELTYSKCSSQRSSLDTTELNPESSIDKIVLASIEQLIKDSASSNKNLNDFEDSSETSSIDISMIKRLPDDNNAIVSLEKVITDISTSLEKCELTDKKTKKLFSQLIPSIDTNIQESSKLFPASDTTEVSINDFIMNAKSSVDEQGELKSETSNDLNVGNIDAVNRSIVDEKQIKKEKKKVKFQEKDAQIFDVNIGVQIKKIEDETVIENENDTKEQQESSMGKNTFENRDIQLEFSKHAVPKLEENSVELSFDVLNNFTKNTEDEISEVLKPDQDMVSIVEKNTFEKAFKVTEQSKQDLALEKKEEIGFKISDLSEEFFIKSNEDSSVEISEEELSKNDIYAEPEVKNARKGDKELIDEKKTSKISEVMKKEELPKSKPTQKIEIDFKQEETVAQIQKLGEKIILKDDQQNQIHDLSLKVFF